jgi:hypothetical protein
VTRARYARYVLARFAESLAIAAGAALLGHILQCVGLLRPFGWGLAWLRAARHAHAGQFLKQAEWWARPASWAVLAHVLFGPKQRRPVYLRIPGAMYAYAGISVDRNAGCRGGCVTGATGSGKTLACIMPRLHSLCVNEAGVEHPEWAGSPQKRAFEETREMHRAAAEAARAEVKCLEPRDGARSGALLAVCDRSAEGMRSAADTCRRSRYRIPPWGGFVCGEKGNEWQAVESLLRHHGREEDLCILRTRPQGAPNDWGPAVRFNLISMDEIPADTYAKMIVDTGLAVEESGTRDEFFVPQARDKIAWGIRLVRAVKEMAGTARASRAVPDGNPSLLTLLDILTVRESYRRYLSGCCARYPGLETSDALAEARFQLENNYWNQPSDQLGGVRSTLYNFLMPFAEPEIAEVFCSDSTFDLRDMQLGKILCLAIPQRFAVQRRYVATLMKTLAYQVVLERFDRSANHPDWLNRNIVLVEQDEWQRHAVRADCEVDVVREARGAVYAATQSQNSVWLKLGGRENAAPMIANLRNRWICQAATEECADESSNLVSGQIAREVSYTHGEGGRSTNISFQERPLLPRRELRALKPFHVVFAPAEGRWLYRKCIAMPATAEGGIPPWWFGDWNPAHWAAHLLRLPRTLLGFRIHPGDGFVPPWRACAPWKAQVRRLCGLDGTFIILGGRRRDDAADGGKNNW